MITGWLAQKENYQWLDFGSGNQQITPMLWQLMVRRESNVYRVFTAEGGEAPIGLVALSDVSRTFRTAMLWYVLGEKRWAGRGCTTRAVARMLTLAFAELGLRAVNAWAVSENLASIRILERNHFRLIGRQRQCHGIDGRALDRLLFDLLASEHPAA
jgi:RimJ/RimL family protein N-acetyltransferase